MRILVFESNLMWSARLMQTLRGLGHDPILASAMPESTDAKAAIVNLGDQPGELVSKLHTAGVKVIAHAGHKEKDLMALGRAAGVDILATNSQLTFKMAELLEQVEIPEASAE